MASLLDYDWPGNIRELQNVLERAVILAIGPELEVRVRSAAEHEARCPDPVERNARRRAARAHRAVLESTHGVVAGPNGAGRTPWNQPIDPALSA